MCLKSVHLSSCPLMLSTARLPLLASFHKEVQRQTQDLSQKLYWSFIHPSLQHASPLIVFSRVHGQSYLSSTTINKSRVSEHRYRREDITGFPTKLSRSPGKVASTFTHDITPSPLLSSSAFLTPFYPHPMASYSDSVVMPSCVFLLIF